MIGNISPTLRVVRHYEDASMRVRLIAQCENGRRVVYRVEVRKGGENGTCENHVFDSGLGFDQFNMALGAFKGEVLPMVDL